MTRIRQTMTFQEFQTALKAQGVPLEHMALRCPVCGTIQSALDLARAGAGATFADVEKYLGFSCVGRFTGAGPWKRGEEPGRGCDWTLGGLFQLHTLEVVTEDGKHHPRFEPVSAEEAHAHMVLRPGPGEARDALSRLM